MGIKKRIISIFAACIMLIAAGCGSVSGTDVSSVNGLAQDSLKQSSQPDNIKTLIVYYSYTGTVQRVAQHLQKLTGGTLYELELSNPYTGNSDTVSDRVFKERGDKKMPELSGELPDILQYDEILIGTPVWNNSMSNPVASYLEQTDFAGKTVAPFWNYITNQGTTKSDFIKQSKNATMAESLPIRSANGISDKQLDQTLTNWLNKVRGK